MQASSSLIIINYPIEERKRKRYKKIEYLENEKSFLDEIKIIFYKF